MSDAGALAQGGSIQGRFERSGDGGRSKSYRAEGAMRIRRETDMGRRGSLHSDGVVCVVDVAHAATRGVGTQSQFGLVAGM